jgi:hypothetical protein
MSFKLFLEEAEKGWVAKKAEILSLWGSLKPGQALNFDPIPHHVKGSRYNSDGIRITGTSRFINSVLSRFKELLQYEQSPYLKLDVSYQQIMKNYDPNKEPKYVCYIHLVYRDKKGIV